MNVTVVTACNARYAIGAKGLLSSLRAFHPEVRAVCLVPAGEAGGVGAVLGGLAEVREAPRPVRGVPGDWKLQLLAARVFTPTLGGDVAVWVDSDVVFCNRADELFDVAPGRVNVVRDPYRLGNMVPPALWPLFERQFGLPPGADAFNAGIYALRTADWSDLPERYEAALTDGGYPVYPPTFDQALLNGLMLRQATWLPRTFNALLAYELGVPRDVRLLHFTSYPKLKPWMPGFDKASAEYLYWVRYGEQERRAWRLLATRLRYYSGQPRRFTFKAVRKCRWLLGLYKEEFTGVMDEPPAPLATRTDHK